MLGNFFIDQEIISIENLYKHLHFPVQRYSLTEKFSQATESQKYFENFS